MKLNMFYRTDKEAASNAVKSYLYYFLKTEFNVPDRKCTCISEALFNMMKDNRYHNFYHIFNMINFAETNNIKLSSEELLAIFFHDAVVYNYPKKNLSNEEASAMFMKAVLFPFASEGFLKNVSDIILDTAKYLEPDSEVSRKSFKVMDLDLSSFASDHFGEDCVMIEEEFNHIEIFRFREGRLALLKKFYDKAKANTLYRTEDMKKFNSVALENLEKQMNLLDNYLKADLSSFKKAK